MKSKSILFLFVLLFIQKAFAESVNISQIDNSSLLLDQNIRVYISITDNKGLPIKRVDEGKITVSESSDEKNFKKVKVQSFKPEANYERGINFLLLLDNSGSMYFDLNGRETSDEEKTRISQAKRAVIEFINSIKNPADKVGIASYNSYYEVYSMPVSDKNKIINYLDEIKKPSGEEGWTEIYSSLYLAAEDFSQISGRKAIIILSDGENRPFYVHTGKPHRDFGKKVFKYQEAIEKNIIEGVSVFTINYGNPADKKDSGLKSISYNTGGVVFDAYNEEELKSVYSKIRERILSEIMITYKAGMEPAEKKYVKVEMTASDNSKVSSTRYYISSMIFGMPLKESTPWLLLAILIALLLLWLLSMIKFKNRNTQPLLEILDAPRGTIVSRTLALTKNQTVIGGSKNADLTILNAPSVKEEHATIVFDQKTQVYALKSKEDVLVNNKPVKTKILESGDVINVGGTTIVFDEGEIKKKR